MKPEIEKIDFVITWVDGNDPEWLKERNYYETLEHGDIDNCNVRFRDWETLRYWFRGVEKFAPWVNKIFFVTWGHVPQWLDTSHPKLQIVKHADYIPEEFLPTFNSYVIEFYFHKIKGLSDKFVYFNDDMFLINHVSPSRFFRNGLPCDLASIIERNYGGMGGVAVYLARQLINEHFDKFEVVRKNFTKWINTTSLSASLRNLVYLRIRTHEFNGFYDHHLAQGYLKSTYDEVWSHCKNDLIRMSKNRFRQYGDVAIWLVRYWQLASGAFTPYKVNKDGICFFTESHDSSEIADTISQQKYNIILINDSDQIADFESYKRTVLEAFELILPEQSSYEK